MKETITKRICHACQGSGSVQPIGSTNTTTGRICPICNGSGIETVITREYPNYRNW